MIPGLLQTLKQLPSSYHLLPLYLVFLEGILTTYINSNMNNGDKSNRPIRNFAGVSGCGYALPVYEQAMAAEPSREHP